jgi:hypothetical protein
LLATGLLATELSLLVALGALAERKWLGKLGGGRRAKGGACVVRKSSGKTDERSCLNLDRVNSMSPLMKTFGAVF